MGVYMKTVTQLHNAISGVLRKHMGSKDRVITPEMDQAETLVLDLLHKLASLATEEKKPTYRPVEEISYCDCGAPAGHDYECGY
jgi:hypothetical protein